MKRKDLLPINKQIPQVLKLHNITLDGDRPEFFYLKFAKKPHTQSSQWCLSCVRWLRE